MNAWTSQAKEASAAELINADPVQRVMPATNADNLSTTGRQQVNIAEESVVFMTKSEVEAMLTKEKEKEWKCVICQDLKLSYPIEVATKQYPVGYGIAEPIKIQ